MFARLSRIVPMLIVLAVVAAIVYIVAAWRYSPNRAKELLIRIFTAITGAVSAFFLLVCAYAWLERNGAVFDLSFSFLLTALIGLAATRICRAVFCATTPRTASRPRRRRLRVPVSGVGGRNRKTLLRGFEMRWRGTCELARTPTPTAYAGASRSWSPMWRCDYPITSCWPG